MPRPLRALALLTPALALLSACPSVASAAPPAAATSVATLGASVSGEARVEAAPGGFAVLVPEPFAEPDKAEEPRSRAVFSRAVYVYAPVPGGKIARRVALHHEPQDREAAIRSARLVARLLRLHRDRFGRPSTFPRDAEEAHVWLTPGRAQNTRMGGETRGHDVYLLDTSAARTPLEWVRTLAHEWGHLTLPAARGFESPESDAAGFLGERLFFKWLREDPIWMKARLPDDGTTRADLDLYHRRQVAPLMERFQNGGPNSKLLTGTDTEAMDYYVGAVLACDAALGSPTVGAALFSIEDVRPRDFLAAVQRVTAAKNLSVRLPAWVPLSRARYAVKPAPGRSGSVAVSGRGSLNLKPGRSVSVRVPSAGWRFVRPASGHVPSIVLVPEPSAEAAE